MRNRVSGEIKEVTREEFLALFDAYVRDRIVELSEREDVDAVVCFENLQMDSSHFGDRSAVIVGLGCTIKIEDLADAHLGSVPSIFQYPTHIWRIHE